MFSFLFLGIIIFPGYQSYTLIHTVYDTHYEYGHESFQPARLVWLESVIAHCSDWENFVEFYERFRKNYCQRFMFYLRHTEHVMFLPHLAANFRVCWLESSSFTSPTPRNIHPHPHLPGCMYVCMIWLTRSRAVFACPANCETGRKTAKQTPTKKQRFFYK